MSTETNLKGRWVKALINGPVSISSWRQGEYRKITSDDGTRIEGHYRISPYADYCELMPEGFTPDKVIHEFQRGSWYRTIGTQFTTNKYIKFFIFDDAKKVVYSERITHAGEHHIFKAEHNYQRSSIAHPTDSLVLVPDEEVAEYINKIINSFPIY